nr:uncharacterized protein C2orf50 homolog isoform X2 [Zootoca vivipara]
MTLGVPSNSVILRFSMALQSPFSKKTGLEHQFQPRSSSQSARTLLATTQSSVKQSSKGHGGEEQEALKADQVRQDTVWREFVEAERRATKYWYRNWSFLKDYDPLGKIKEPEQLPEYMSVFSDKIPNTSGHVIGSRMNTDLGKTLVKMDYFLNYGRRKNKLGQELQAS